jgi:hypothetical protein
MASLLACGEGCQGEQPNDRPRHSCRSALGLGFFTRSSEAVACSANARERRDTAV